MFYLDDFRQKCTTDADVTMFMNIASLIKVLDLVALKDPFELIPAPAMMADTLRCQLYQHLPRVNQTVTSRCRTPIHSAENTFREVGEKGGVGGGPTEDDLVLRKDGLGTSAAVRFPKP